MDLVAPMWSLCILKYMPDYITISQEKRISLLFDCPQVTSIMSMFIYINESKTSVKSVLNIEMDS